MNIKNKEQNKTITMYRKNLRMQNPVEVIGYKPQMAVHQLEKSLEKVVK